MTKPSKLPAGARLILPTIWGSFLLTVALALAFSFGNVWNLGRVVHVEGHIAPLIGPSVDITAAGLLVVVPWLVLAGIAPERMRSANRLMAAAGFLTLALNSAPSAIVGWVQHDPLAWGRAGMEAVVPALLIAWSHVGPKLVALFAEVMAEHRAALVEAAEVRAAEVAEAVAEALSRAAAEHATGVAVEVAKRAEVEATLASTEAELRTLTESSTRRIAQVEAEIEQPRQAPRRGGTSTPRRAAKRQPRTSAEDSERAPRKSANELLEERVEAAKEALPTWQLETPSGTEIASALGLKSDGIAYAIRKRIDADRLAIAQERAA